LIYIGFSKKLGKWVVVDVLFEEDG